MITLESLQHTTHVAEDATWPFTAIATALFAMRLYATFVLSATSTKYEDFVLILSWVLDVCRQSFFQKGLYTIRSVNESNAETSLPASAFWILFSDSWSLISIVAPKLSIGLLLVRIFRPKPWTKMLILMSCYFLCAVGFAGFFISVFQCSPVDALWNPAKHPNARCNSEDIASIFSIVVGAISSIMDLAFAIYPGVVIWTLKMSLRKRLSTMALTGLGVASCAVASVKIYYVTKFLGHPSVFELLYHGTFIAMWCSLENDFVMAAACLPSIPIVCRTCSKSIKSQVSKSATRLSSYWTQAPTLKGVDSDSQSSGFDYK